MAGGHPTQSTNKGPWIWGRWLWLLTNQLYRPTSPSVTPALGIRFAVDGCSSLSFSYSGLIVNI